ncbi:3'-5' exonuclease [Actinoallomurus oryzae]|uniref:DNA 3'-5' helicase n=1 Tax=Actinoallomurus oryzae TaxID=502180 RepID=A0ABP8QUT3_9ACTN
MRILPPVAPTPEQLTILADSKPGYTLIRGAAGSGKTTTALLRLRQLCDSWLARRNRLGIADPVRVLVLTYNRTLEGYITELARQQIAGSVGLQLEVYTFGKWAKHLLGDVDIIDRDASTDLLRPLLTGFQSEKEFLLDEIEYLLGRFLPDDLESYLTARRDGRGTSPRVEQSLRQRLLDEVVGPYSAKKQASGVLDWNDVAVQAGKVSDVPPWDVVVIDEAQDFHANQIRAIVSHLAEPFSMTLVIDAIQRIYPRFFSWKEAGVTEFARVHRLGKNYRNTKQIAAFARPLVEGIPLDDDGALPNFDACNSEGSMPIVVAGTYSEQIDYMLRHLATRVDLADQSVVFMQVRGSGWFNYLRQRLRNAGLPWVELQRASEWPTGTEAIALCTMHSAKGLEFDHVLMPGLNGEVTPHGSEEGDTQLDQLRRLVAMALGRARKSVMVGYKPEDPSTIIQLLNPETFELVQL